MTFAYRRFGADSEVPLVFLNRFRGTIDARLGDIKQPVFVANGSNVIMVSTIISFIMAQRLPNAQLMIYPDSGHGFLFQYAELFSENLSLFEKQATDIRSGYQAKWLPFFSV